VLLPCAGTEAVKPLPPTVAKAGVVMIGVAGAAITTTVVWAVIWAPALLVTVSV